MRRAADQAQNEYLRNLRSIMRDAIDAGLLPEDFPDKIGILPKKEK